MYVIFKMYFSSKKVSLYTGKYNTHFMVCTKQAHLKKVMHHKCCDMLCFKAINTLRHINHVVFSHKSYFPALLWRQWSQQLLKSCNSFHTWFYKLFSFPFFYSNHQYSNNCNHDCKTQFSNFHIWKQSGTLMK